MPSKKNKSAKKKTTQQRDRGNAAGHNLTLPLDVIGPIAKILQNQLQLKTCANVNVASRAVYQETLPILYKIDEEWRIDPTVVDPSRPLHTVRDIPETCCKASVTVIPNSNPGINIVVVYIWENYEYGGSDLPVLLNSIGLVYQMCKLKRNPLGTVGNTNRLILIAMSYANAYSALESPRLL
ncbi:hypothetical protein QFC20_001384 [Naganishia adeliensis]|uniref:Uncharacterized protein n=1 Tax=Naganishia adeliensis TaxID=92952 RepID=A0ACC2WTS9_9TREE|nr:hypothetical protein QFC20_001384 [Naganishia adeliensis]